METFVEKGRFLGTCYQAANIQHVGTTQGRGRQDRGNEYGQPVKDIYLYPLCSDVRERLCEGQAEEVREAKLPSDWAEEEFGNAILEDQKLTGRLIVMSRDFYARPQGNIPQACQSRARTKAELAIRCSSVELKTPAGKRGKGNIKVWAIPAQEENAPESVTPLKWMLLTTIPVNTFEESVEKLEWYTKRWGIEIYHKTLKSGCQIEQRQLGNAKRIEACLAIDMVVAWRIYYLTKLGREVPDVPCTVFFEEAEWKALVAYKTKSPIPPSNPPSLREAVRMVASLGGFLGRKGDGEPGTKTLWLGIQRLDDMTAMWKVFVTEFTPHSLSPP
ncbi:MAG: IS4 family transposase [Candidatus Brocadiaceae bacterium]